MKRVDGRAPDEIRSVSVEFDRYGFADASVILELGNTIVMASVSLSAGVPFFLKGQNTGWLSAEYAMLPSATQQRTAREAVKGQRDGRSVEISRLIGRCLRTTVDVTSIGERTITIDCDVLQADGGTRVACITAASLALAKASQRWLDRGLVAQPVFKEFIAGISVGVVNGVLLTDLAYIEDSQADADFNFVISHSGSLIEVQGTSEKAPIAWSVFEQLKNMACDGIKQIWECTGVGSGNSIGDKIDGARVASSATSFAQKQELIKQCNQQIPQQNRSRPQDIKSQKQPFFSLGNRISS